MPGCTVASLPCACKLRCPAALTTLRSLQTSCLCPATFTHAVTLLLLGLSGFTNSLALFWLLLVLTLQRGPITPCDEELSPIQDSGVKAAAIAALLLPLLVLLPYPAAVSFTGGMPDLPPTF